jgi:hypothetical protein
LLSFFINLGLSGNAVGGSALKQNKLGKVVALKALWSANAIHNGFIIKGAGKERSVLA